LSNETAAAQSSRFRGTVRALACAIAVAASAQTTPPMMQMTTDIPVEITTPDSVATSFGGTFKFFDGIPDKGTILVSEYVTIENGRYREKQVDLTVENVEYQHVGASS
jgi:hypothetical protein